MRTHIYHYLFDSFNHILTKFLRLFLVHIVGQLFIHAPKYGQLKRSQKSHSHLNML